MKKGILIKEKILDIVRASPGISAPEVAVKMDMSRISAYTYLKSLIQSEQVRTDGKGKVTRYFLRESMYIRANIGETSGQGCTQSQIQELKQEILFALQETYNEGETEENLNAVFDRYCMYITSDDSIIKGFDAFLAWCTDPKRDFSGMIVQKALEYLEIVASIEIRRKKMVFWMQEERHERILMGLGI